MPKETQKGSLARALRNSRVMAGVIKDAYESGNLDRAEAAMELMDEFTKDVKEVLGPILLARDVAKATAEAAHAQVVS